ncbi:MAG: hypothetical protein ACREQL_01845, partial [Candidatus Binatia bacterium]
MSIPGIRPTARGRYRVITHAAILVTLAWRGSPGAHTFVVDTGDCTWTYGPDHCVARPLHPRPECQAGHINTDCNCGVAGCVTSGCVPDITTGSVPEVPNGVDDDCDYYVDDEQCDGIDNDGDGHVDEDPGSCLLKFLFVPLCWQGDQTSFEAAVAAQFGRFALSLGLGACLDNFRHHVGQLATDNLPCPSCTDDNCGAGSVIPEVRQRFANWRDFDQVVALTDHTICDKWVGCNAGGTMWVTAKGAND